MEKISLNTVLDTVFDSTKTAIKHQIIRGEGIINQQHFHLLGTTESAMFGVDESIEMAEQVLTILKSKDTHPILLLVDVIGQKLSPRDEWLGMYAYFAHLLKCLHLARQKGHPMISLIYNQAIGGSFIAFGMMADRIYALSNAQLAVMWLEGMAKVTKIDIEILREISKSSPVFAPGAENFKQLGGLHQVLTLDQVANKLLETLQEPDLKIDNRAALGKKSGGRPKAYDIITQIEHL